MGYDETTNLKLKKPTVGTSKTDWPGYINGNFDTIDAEVANRCKKGDPFSEITLGGVTRSTWPSPGSGSQSMDDAYNNGSVVAVDNTDEVHRLSAGKKFKLMNADGSFTYMEAEGGKGITLPDVRQNLIANSQFAVWSNATLENVGSTLITNGTFDADTSGWTPGNGAIASVSGGQSGNCLQITLSSGSVQYADSSAIATVAGKLYRLTAYVKSGTGGTSYIVQAFNSGKTVLLGQAAGNTTGSWVQISFVFRAYDATSYVRLIKNTSTAGTMLFDEVTVVEITPACVGADTKAMDGWGKTSGTLLYRQFTDALYTKNGSLYALKATGGSASHQAYWPGPGGIYGGSDWRALFRGRTVTFGCWVWCASPSNARISIYDTQDNYSAYHSGSGAWEWLEITRTVPAATPYFYISLYPGASATAYFSQPQLVFGLSIGPGNYLYRPGETIWLDTPAPSSALDNKSGLSTTAATTITIEADALGLIGKGARAVYLSMTAYDSASAGGDAQVTVGPLSGNQPFSCSPGGLANGRAARAQGWVPLYPDGTLAYVLTATGSGTLSIASAKIIGVQF